MKAFVTGGTGFVGRTLADELLSGRWQGCLLARSGARSAVLPREAVRTPSDSAAADSRPPAAGGRFGLPGHVQALQACYDTLGAS